MKKTLRVLGLLSLLALQAPPAPAQSQLDEKLRLEQTIAQEVTSILDKFLGPGKSHVTVLLGVDVKPWSPASGRFPTDKKAPDAKSPNKKQPGLQTKWLWTDVARKSKMTVLPGFSIAPEMAVSEDRKPEPKPPVVKEDKKEEPPPANEPVFLMEVNRMLVSVVLDRSVPEKSRQIVEVMVSEVLGLDPDRGDKLNVYALPLMPAWERLLLAPSSIGNIAWILLWVVVGVLFLWLLTKSILAVLRNFGILPEKKPASSGAEKEGAKTKAGSGREKASNEKASSAESKGIALAGQAPALIFDFIKKDNASLVSEILAGCQAQDAANLIGFLEPELAAQVLNNLSARQRLEVLGCLAWAKSMPPEYFQELHDIWQNRMAHAFGGSESVGNLLSDVDHQQQNLFIQGLSEKSPELAAKIRRSLVSFEDLAEMKDADLALLAQSIPFQDWAQALSGMSNSYVDRLMNVLPVASRPALQQWVSLTVPNEAQAAQARAKISKLARGLAREGRIHLPRSGAPAGSAAPGLPPEPVNSRGAAFLAAFQNTNDKKES